MYLLNGSLDGPRTVTTSPAQHPATTNPPAPVATAPVQQQTTTEEQRVEQQPPLVIQDQNIEASFSYDQQLRRVVIVLTREETGEVVEQIPQEHLRRFATGMMELAGNLFDVKV